MEYYNYNSDTDKDDNNFAVSGIVINELSENSDQEQTYGTKNVVGQGFATIEDVIKIVQEALSSLKIYVLESDITEAQNSIRAIVKQSTF